ncbi:MAG: hypothetical protein ACREPZ_09240 [Rhodanobacteraceae bacterium]
MSRVLTMQDTFIDNRPACAAVIIFLIGLISGQIISLTYRRDR